MLRNKHILRLLFFLSIHLLGLIPFIFAQGIAQNDSLTEETLADTLPIPIANSIVTAADTSAILVVDSSGILGTIFPKLDSIFSEKPDADTSEPDSLDKSTSRPASFREEIAQAPDIRQIISFSKIFWSLIFIVFGYFLIKAISGILSLISERNVKYKGVIRRILPVVKIVGWSMIVYIIIGGIFQPRAETVFAFFASVGVAIGFASQDLLKNIFGGLMILFDKPFQIGDKIEAGNYYGEVLEIGLRSTRIVTPDDSIVTIPNSEMMNQSISNANSGENNCQVVAEFFFPVTIDTKRVRQIAVEAAQISQYIYLNKPIVVVFSNITIPKGSLLKMRLKAYVNDVRYEFPFQSEMTEIVFREMNKEGLLEGI